MAAIANAARHGVLIKGGAYLEIAEKLRAVAFDKTGTLTIGRPMLTDIIPCNKLSGRDILSLAGGVESRSEHPLAEAVVRRAKEEGLTLTQGIQGFEAITGLGVKAIVDGKSYFIGSRRLFMERGIPLTQNVDDQVFRLEKEGKTILLVGDEQNLLGIMAVADTLRKEARETIRALKNLNIAVLMLTGDNEKTAEGIARQAGVDEYLAQLLPEDKVGAVRELKTRFGKIAMVGDGVNDAPAMAVSDVGIAMGAAGTDVAMETGDVALMSDDLSKIPYAFRLSRRSVRNIRQNIAVSLAIVAFLVPAALFGWVRLLPGLILNEASAMIVILNGLRLLKG